MAKKAESPFPVFLFFPLRVVCPRRFFGANPESRKLGGTEPNPNCGSLWCFLLLFPFFGLDWSKRERGRFLFFFFFFSLLLMSDKLRRTIEELTQAPSLEVEHTVLFSLRNVLASEQHTVELFTTQQILNDFVQYLFNRRFGWSEVESAGAPLNVRSHYAF